MAQAAAAGYLNPGGVTVDLTVLGADDGGESALTDTWSTTGTPPASVSFSDNSTKRQRPRRHNSTRWARTRRYTPVLTSIVPTPRTGFVSVGGTQQFTPHAYDQFGYEITPYRPPGGWFWSASGGGTITADGLFTAGSVPGEFVVTLRQSVLYVHRHRDVPGHTIDHGGESPISAT